MTEARTQQVVVDKWWLAFNDPQLDVLVNAALSNNTDYAAAVARVDEARAQYQIASAAMLPTLGAGGGVARTQDLSAFGLAQLGTGQQVGLDASYEADLFGRLREAKGAARAQWLSTEAARDTVRLAVISATVSGYVNLVALDARLKVLRQTLTSRENALHIAERKSSDGYGSQLEAQQAQAEYQATKQQIPVTELAIRKLEDGLSVLVGRNPEAIARNPDLAALKPLPMPSALPSDLLRRRPDIATAEEQLVASDHSLDVARAAFMPGFEITASGGYLNSTLIPKGIAPYNLAAGFALPIFEGGKLHGQSAAAASRRDQAAYAYRKVALNAFKEVEDSMASVTLAQEQAEDLEAQRAALAAGLKLATNRYQAGYSPYLEQLDAERGLLASELALIQARADILNAYIGLYQSLGGGWEASRLASR